MTSRRSGLLLFRQINACQQPSTLLSKNAVVVTSFPVSLNHVRQISFNHVLYGRTTDRRAEERRRELAKKFETQLEEEKQILFDKFNGYLADYFASVPIDEFDITVTLKDGKERKIKSLGTIKYEIPFSASLDLNHNPAIVPEIKLALIRLYKPVILQGNVLHISLPIKFKDESHNAEAKKVLFEEIDEYGENIVIKFNKAATLNNMAFDSKLYYTTIKPKLELLWKYFELRQKYNNAYLKGNSLETSVIKIKLFFVRYKLFLIRNKQSYTRSIRLFGFVIFVYTLFRTFMVSRNRKKTTGK